MQYNRMTDAAILKAHPNTQYAFQQWKARVDKICVKAFMMPSSCLPDAGWRCSFESSLTPREAVESAVEFCWRYEPGVQDCWYGDVTQ